MKHQGRLFDLFEPARESDPLTARAGAWDDLRGFVRKVPPVAAHRPFRLRIDEAGGVLRDPSGHFEHWAVVYGVLDEGALRPNDRILFPSVRGHAWSARVYNVLVGKKAITQAEPVDGELEVLVAYPAPPTDALAGTHATDCDSATHDRTAAALLAMCGLGAYGYFHCRVCVASLRDGGGPAFADAARARIAGGDELAATVLLNTIEFSPADREYLLGLTRDPRASVRREAAYVLYDERFAPGIGLLEALRENDDPEVRRVAQAIQRRGGPA